MKDMNEYPCRNCANCPLVKGVIEISDGLRDGAEAMGVAALGEDVEQVAQRVFESIPEGASLLGPDGDVKPIESVEDIVTVMRSSTTSALEDMDAKRERLKGSIGLLTDSCDGPLKMRAARAGQLVTVTVCMSPETPEDSQVTEHATVYRGNRI